MFSPEDITQALRGVWDLDKSGEGVWRDTFCLNALSPPLYYLCLTLGLKSDVTCSRVSLPYTGDVTSSISQVHY